MNAAPACKVIATTLATDLRHDEPKLGVALAWALRKLLPAANPDLEGLYHLVRLWWVEIDEQGTPQREIGFDGSGQPVVAGPVGRNMGFWTDSPMTFHEGEYQAISPRLFEEVWSKTEIVLSQKGV